MRISRPGWPRGQIISAAAVAMGLGAIGVLLPGAPVSLSLAAGMVFSAVGGLIPGALFAGVARHAPEPARISTVNGLLLQGVALGQLTGPSSASVFADAADSWAGVLWFALPATGLTLLLAYKLAQLETAR